MELAECSLAERLHVCRIAQAVEAKKARRRHAGRSVTNTASLDQLAGPMSMRELLQVVWCAAGLDHPAGLEPARAAACGLGLLLTWVSL